MLKLGPERTFVSRYGKQFRGRVIYADTKLEMYEVLKKIGQPFKRIRENPWRYLLSKGWGWQLIRLRDKGFVELEEITLMQEQELFKVGKSEN